MRHLCMDVRSYPAAIAFDQTHVVSTSSGVAKPGPTRALARASAHLALASEIDDDH